MKHFFIRTSSCLNHSFNRGWFDPPSICSLFKMRERERGRNPNRGDGKGGGGGRGWGHGIFWGIEEISCWNSRGQLKKKCNFQWWSKCITQFYRISKSKALFCPEFPRVKVEFLWVIKKAWRRKSQVAFSWVLVFDLGISKGCNTFSQNFQG